MFIQNILPFSGIAYRYDDDGDNDSDNNNNQQPKRMKVIMCDRTSAGYIHS